MIHGILTILLFQLLGETVTRALQLPVPGPVLGMIGLALAFSLSPRLVQLLRPVAQGILGNLSLLFVPAGVGVVGHLGRLSTDGATLALIIVVSTTVTITVGVLVFVAVARLCGASAEDGAAGQ